MLAMARPCLTPSAPCTRRLDSCMLTSKPHTCSLSPIYRKVKFLAEREFHITRNRIATNASEESSMKAGQPLGIEGDDMSEKFRELSETFKETGPNDRNMKAAQQLRVEIGEFREKLRELYEGIKKFGPEITGKTWYPKAADHENAKKTWYIVDATDKRLGRLASTIAIYIRGKNLPTFTPSVDMGGYVIVVNAEKVAVTGNKRSQKVYKRYSGRPGGQKEETFDNLQKRIPERIIEHAVRGMLPKGRLGRRLFTHLKVYKGPNHPHEAQKPVPLPVRDKRIMIEK